MQFVLIGHFYPGAGPEREAVHERFNEHLMQRVTRVRYGGPLYDEAGIRSGVMLIVDAADFAAAEAFLRASPYQEADLLDRVEISEVRPEVGGLK